MQFIIVFIRNMYMYTGISSELGKPTKDTVNPLYDTSTITDDHKKEVPKPDVYYEEVNISSDVKMTKNPAYAIP